VVEADAEHVVDRTEPD